MVLGQQSGGPGKAPDRARVPAGSRVYAVGDIHGRADLLGRIRGLIEDDARRAEARRKVVIYLGDYVDRGPGSFEVIERLAGEPLEGFESVHLKGNHEDFLLRFLDDPAVGDIWLFNGAAATMKSYGIEVADATPAGLEELRRKLRDALPPHHLDFFRGLERYHVEGDYFFVHAGVKPGLALERQSDKDLLWIREEFLTSEADFGKIVVHGHTPAHTPSLRPNRIGIDTGAVFTDRLTCLVLEDADRRFLHT